ncbi:LOW QUALITY PROTEIN: transportin-3-like [Liolophura sinensis]|uniref:LOW QUALITY PROTEIN: transportin-3-like n=1 Tax=Liolophura sinensis TaxID=3198878 RepID=UPI0031592DBF
MESVPTIETVQQALHALYRNPDVVGKEKASVWLGELQRSVFAWQVADQLLRLNHDLESCYFAAQTMRTKIQYAFHELPAASHQSLRDSLLDHASKVTVDTPPSIVTQLSLALADLALQMASWKGAPTDLIQKFGNSIQNLPFLLEVLTVLPEEVRQLIVVPLRLGANRRKDITEEFQSASPAVLHLLEACLESCQSDPKIQVKVFRCLGSWFGIGAVPQNNTKLLMAPFHILSLCQMSHQCTSSLHEAATDCICNALYCAEDITNNLPLAELLLQGVLSLVEGYQMSVAEEDMDKSVNYCRIFTEMAESVLESLVSTPTQGLGDFRILELLLTCVGHHQYEVAEITFNFWYRLSEDLYQKNDEHITSLFKPFIQRLVIALCRHCQIDPDHEGVPNESDDFYDFRIKSSELIKDIVFIVGPLSCFTHMFENLKAPSTTWDMSEASLFVMSAVAKNILPEENEIVPQVIQAILSLPENTHIAVRHTSIQLIGELCEWIEHHKQVLEPVLQFLLSGLQNPQLATVAATSLQSVCSMCRDQMTDHFTGLIQIVQAVDSFSVSNEAALGLLKGTATILGRMPHDKVTEGLKQLCSFQLTPLQKLLEEETGPPTKDKNKDPTVWLDRLAAIFRHTNPTINNGQIHPCQPVIQEVWPVLSAACEKYQADVRVIERFCRCVRFAVRCVGKGSASLLTPLVSQMVTLYQSHQHSCFLYLGSILVDEYGGDQSCVPGLLEMLQAFCVPTFKILEEPNGLRNHPDTVDDLFRLALRFTQRSPVSFLQCPMAKPILCCAIAAVSLDHRDANASIMKYLTDFIKSARDNEDKADFECRQGLVLSMLQEHGQALTHALLHACIFSLPSFMMADIADVMYELMLIDRPIFCKWLESSLKSLPTESSGGSVTATHKQLTDFHKSVTSAETTKQVSHALRDFSACTDEIDLCPFVDSQMF